MNTKQIIIGIVMVVIAGIAYYGISPLFRNVRVDEPLPPADKMSQDQSQESSGADMMSSPETGEEIIMSMRSPIVATAAHPASGFVQIISFEGKSYVRYEDLKTINGPDIYVYLSKDLDAKEYVEVGRVRATEGNINYEIPADVDPRNYPYVLIWCKAFGVLFNSAKVY